MNGCINLRCQSYLNTRNMKKIKKCSLVGSHECRKLVDLVENVAQTVFRWTVWALEECEICPIVRLSINLLSKLLDRAVSNSNSPLKSAVSNC